MKKYARFGVDPKARFGVVLEVITDPVVIGGVEYPIEQSFTAEFITWLREAPDNVEVGDSYDQNTDTWSKPVAIANIGAGGGKQRPPGDA